MDSRAAGAAGAATGVLLVDDDAVTRRTVEALLRKCGYGGESLGRCGASEGC